MPLTGGLRRLRSYRPERVRVALALAAPRPIDGAFIPLRCAHNRPANERCWYYLGRTGLGKTTPLYTGLMATVAGLRRSENYPWLTLLVNALGEAATGLLVYRRRAP